MVVSIARLVYSLDVGSVDGSWDAIPAGYMSCIELTVGFLVVSIPVYRALYKKVFKPETGGSTGWSYNLKSDGVPLRYNNNNNSSSYNSGKGGSYGSYGSHTTASSGHDDDLLPRNRSDEMVTLPGHTVTVAATDRTAHDMPSARVDTCQGISVRDDVHLGRLAYKNGAWVKVPEEETMPN